MGQVSKAIFLVALSFCFVFAQQSGVHDSRSTKFDKAVAMYQARQYFFAQRLFSDFIRDTDNTDIYVSSRYYNALCALGMKHEGAAGLLKAFADDFPTAPRVNHVYFVLGKYLFDNRKYVESIGWFDKVETHVLPKVQLDEYNFKLGYAKLSTGDYEGAKLNFLEIDKYSTYKDEANYYYGHICYEQGNYKLALAYFDRIKKSQVYVSLRELYLTKIYFKQQRYQKAIFSANQYLSRVDAQERKKVGKSAKSVNSEISKIVGESYFHLRKYEESIPYLLEYKGRFAPQDYYQLGFAYYKQGDYKEAISYYNKIISGSDKLVQHAYYQLAICYMKLDDKVEAVNAFRSAAYMDYDKKVQENSWANYAKLSYQVGNIRDDTSQVLLKYLELYPNSKQRQTIYDYLINSYMASKQYELALKIVRNLKKKIF